MTEFEKEVSKVLLHEEAKRFGFKRVTDEEIREFANGNGTPDNPYTTMPEPRIYKEGE